MAEGSVSMTPTLTRPQDLVPVRPSLDTLLTFVGMLPKRSAKQLSGSAEELLRNLSDIISDLLAQSIEKRTLAEFVSIRNEVFPDYYRILHAISDLASVVVPDRVLERLMDDSLSEIEADFREQGIARFGSAVQEQALFTIWTMRRTSSMIRKLIAATAPQGRKDADEKLATEFSLSAAWTQFHLECLSTAVTHAKPIYPEVLPEIVDGLRAAVNAYGLARQGLDLRIPQQEPLLETYEWDEEDQELLDSSTADITPEPD